MWAPQPVALNMIRAEDRNPRREFLGLDALYARGQTELSGQPDGRQKDALALFALVGFADKTLIDLQLVERQRIQHGQGRVSSPEVIQRNLDSHVARFLQDRNVAIDIPEGHFFSDFDRIELGLT